MLREGALIYGCCVGIAFGALSLPGPPPAPKIACVYDDLRLVRAVEEHTGEIATYRCDSLRNILSIESTTGGLPTPFIGSVSRASTWHGDSLCVPVEGGSLCTEVELLSRGVLTARLTAPEVPCIGGKWIELSVRGKR